MQGIINKLSFLNEQLDEKTQKKVFIHKLIRIAYKCEEKKISDQEINHYYYQIISLLINQNYKNYRKVSLLLINYVENHYSLVEKEHYVGVYLSLGISIGTAIGVALMQVNTAFFAIGIACGISIGVAIGTSKDKEALKQNNVY